MVSVARECLKYTGSINGAKMPVVVTIYEVADGPPSEEDRARLAALQKSFPGRAKVGVTLADRGQEPRQRLRYRFVSGETLTYRMKKHGVLLTSRLPRAPSHRHVSDETGS